VTPEQEQRKLRARELHGQGLTYVAIGKELGVSAVTARKYCRGLGLPKNSDSQRAVGESRRNPRNNELANLPERERAFDMIISGMSHHATARVLGKDPRTVRGWVETEIESRVSPRVEKLRAMGNARLDRLRSIAWAVAIDVDQSPKLRLEAIDRVLHIERRWAALNGADSPVRVEAVYTEKTQQDLEMEELFRELEARNAVIEGEIVNDPDPAS